MQSLAQILEGRMVQRNGVQAQDQIEQIDRISGIIAEICASAASEFVWPRLVQVALAP
jgi:hypothetical protein